MNIEKGTIEIKPKGKKFHHTLRDAAGNIVGTRLAVKPYAAAQQVIWNRENYSIAYDAKDNYCPTYHGTWKEQAGSIHYCGRVDLLHKGDCAKTLTFADQHQIIIKVIQFFS